MCQTVSLAGQCNAGAAMTCCPGQIGEEATATCEKRAALFAQTGGEPWREVAEKCYDDSGGRVSRRGSAAALEGQSTDEPDRYDDDELAQRLCELVSSHVLHPAFSPAAALLLLLGCWPSGAPRAPV